MFMPLINQADLPADIQDRFVVRIAGRDECRTRKLLEQIGVPHIKKCLAHLLREPGPKAFVRIAADRPVVVGVSGRYPNDA